jgi:hypothetical protein
MSNNRTLLALIRSRLAEPVPLVKLKDQVQSCANVGTIVPWKLRGGLKIGTHTSEGRHNRWSFNAFNAVVLLGTGLALCSVDPFRGTRERMIAEQIEARGVTSVRVLQAMRSVRRDLFVPEEFRANAYSDRPLPIGSGQTISQPFIVALMKQLLDPARGQRVLEIGTGSGYQAAILSMLAKRSIRSKLFPS